MKIDVSLYTLRLKGYLAYEYNPFYNYLTDEDLYQVNTDVGDILVPKNQAVNKKNGLILNKKYGKWIDSRNNIVNDDLVIEPQESDLYARAGSIVNLDTDKLNFDLEHPVDIEVQPSYDGSVNLILNDNKNIPRLINSRFSARQKNTYEIVDRIGENDTNIYSSNSFEKDTSLYFLYEYNPVILYVSYVKGVLPVGQYCFYLTYCDADDNESDYIAESGLIPLFIGADSDPSSMDGGIKNQSSNKGVKLKITNLDKSYNYLKVYYVRYFADYGLNRVYECKKIEKRYGINSSTLYLQISGYEATEDLDPNLLNISRFNPQSLLTQAQCKNMLFFGNIVKNTDNYKELQDCALRITPKLIELSFSNVNSEYLGSGYYDSLNIYNNVGYFDNEYYRFGVVFIYQNGTLSNVYNTLGGELNIGDTEFGIKGPLFTQEDNTIILHRNYVKIDDSGWIKSVDNGEIHGDYLNARGVCKLNHTYDDNIILGIKFSIPNDVIEFLQNDLNIRGLFFVRQKRVPNILAQCYLMPLDEELEAPVIECLLENDNEESKKYYTECFVTLDDKRYVSNNYNKRLYEYKNVKDDNSENNISKNAFVGICPDFLLQLPYFNLIFNGSSFRIEKITNRLLPVKNGRFYEVFSGSHLTYTYTDPEITSAKICTVTEDVPTVALQDKVYRLEIGETEEAYRFKYCEVDSGTYDAGDEDTDAINESTNIVRGKYSPYLAIYSTTKLETGCLYNIYLSNSTVTDLEYLNRMDSYEPFYAISDRYNFSGLASLEENKIKTKTLVCWRGDCFINMFTYRINRNFNDPSLPNNDVIIDKNTWAENYDVNNSENWSNISRSDLNAILMGSWLTFRVRSPYNYALRSNDHSYVSEEALMGAPRSFYPRSRLLYRGENKMPDSYLYNDAYRATLGYKCYFTLQDINYIKDTFSNRIQYSAISIQDSFKNNYRMSLSTYFRDYSQEYGGIMKLVGFEGYLLVIFEHAIGIAVINERVLAGEGDGEPVFINTSNVLPEELTIITDTYGTQWSESVIKSEAGYVYGVDTIAKKIWRVKGQEIELLSDFKVNKFLIDNISLSERELSPIIGLKNVKTHYNNNKKDIMFTFYDDVYKDEEKVWNLCYNELLGLFITFYSWVPSYSENIDTKFFTFDRTTSKNLSLLRTSNYNIPENTGVLADNCVLDGNSLTTLYYRDPNPIGYVTVLNDDGTTYLRTVSAEDDKVENVSSRKSGLVPGLSFRVERDHWGNYKRIKERLEDGTINGRTSSESGVTITIEANEDFKEAYELLLSLPEESPISQYIETNNTLYNSYRDALQDTNEEEIELKYKALTENVEKIEEELEQRSRLWNIILGLSPSLSSTFKKDDISYFTVNSVRTISNPGYLTSEYYNWVENGNWDGANEMYLALQGGIILLYITPYLNSTTDALTDTETALTFKTELIALSTKNYINNNLLSATDNLCPGISNDFYLHGQAGIFNVVEDLYPTYWYGQFHPFEFEFVVNDKIAQLKIFTNLIIVSNKAEPESFHFEIEGDNYDFSEDKRNMYFRLEATKNLYLNLGSDIIYNKKYTDVVATKNTLELHYRANNSSYTNLYSKLDRVYPIYQTGLVQQVKSTIFPLYYERIDTFNEIYHSYHLMKGSGFDFQNLSGSEIVWNRDLNLFNIVTHIKNSPIDIVGRLRGNSIYKEGTWQIQIPSITFMLKNESPWTLCDQVDDEVSTLFKLCESNLCSNAVLGTVLNLLVYKDLIIDGPLKNRSLAIPPIVVNSLYVPTDIDVDSANTLYNIYTANMSNLNTIIPHKYIEFSDWTYRKETKIRDKWIKIRVRYSGKNLAVIHSLITLYNISYS